MGETKFPKFRYDDRFSDLELTRFNDMFIYFDKQSNGHMEVGDLGLAMRAMGALITDNEIHQLVKKYDPEKSGSITFNDFQQCMAEVQARPDGEEEVRRAFSIFDKYDQSGSMSLNELKHVLTRIGDPIADEEVEQFFALIDNGSGYVSMDEVTRLLMPQTTKDLYSKAVLK